jgi:hypothetical protein
MSTPEPQDTHQELMEFVEKISIPADLQRDFYVFIAVLTDWLGRQGIPYFMHSGTALGCVRHQGFIPWDDDFDIMVEEEHEAKLVAGFADLARYGVRLNEKHADNGHYQFYFKHPSVQSTTKRYYCFDIFIGQRVDVEGRQVLHYKHPDFKRWFHDRYIAVSDVYPLRKVKFGPLQLWAMRDETDYFRRSNFRTDEATLRIHMIDQQWLDERIAYFKKLGLYPIRDADILTRQFPMTFQYAGLDSFIIP